MSETSESTSEVGRPDGGESGDGWDSERAAVLLGASTPWGRVLAESLARRGWSLLLVDPPGDPLERVRERVLELGAETEVLSPAYGDLSSLLAQAGRLPGGLPPVALLVHALPPPVTGRFSERDPRDMVVEVNRGYSSLVVFANRLLPGMIDRGGGRVIVLGSAAARAPLAKAVVHSALAMALPPFLVALEREVHRQGVRTSYLEPAGHASPPISEAVASGPSPVHESHRRFLVSDASVARAFQHALDHPGVRHWRFHAHDRAPPAPSVLRRYTERELHGRHPEGSRTRTGAPASVPGSALRGRTAVVTGASRGIGRQIALRLAAKGMRVVLTGRDAPALEATAKEVRKLGGEPRIHVQDLLSPGAAERLHEVTRESWGTPWLLVNNAGIGFFRRLVRQDDRQLTVQLGVDLLAVLAVTRAFLPSMLEQGGGQVLNVGSLAPEFPLPRLAPYSGTKGAVKGFTLALGREVWHRGLNVSVLEPTTVDTEFIAAAKEPGRRDLREGRMMRYVMIPPEVVGRLAERTVLRPSPVVYVPPRMRALLWMYRALFPIMDRSLRLPAPSTGVARDERPSPPAEA